jgi:hypothetical protein
LVVGDIAKMNKNTSPRPLLHAFPASRPAWRNFGRGFLTVMLNTLFSFAEDFATILVFSCDKFETNLDEFAGVFYVVSYFVMNWSLDRFLNWLFSSGM